MVLNRLIQNVGMVIAQVVAFSLLLWLWSWGARTGHLDGSFFGSPQGVWDTLRMWAKDGTIVKEAQATLRLLAVGLTLGTAAGLLFGLLVGLSQFGRMVLEPFLVFFNGMPRLVLQPFFIIALGLGFASRVALVVAVIFVLVAVSVAAALGALDQTLITNAKLMGAGRVAVARHIYIPWLSVDLLANARANVGFAFQAALVAEFVGSASGLGYLIVRGQNTFFIDGIWAALAIVIVISIALDRALLLAQNRASRWIPSA